MDGLGYDILATLVYAGMGVALLIIGFLMLDAITPGKLGHQIMGDHDGTGSGRRPSINAGLLAMFSQLSIGLIIFTALWTNVDDSLGEAVAWTLIFGLLGIALQALIFKLVDLATPGQLAYVLMEHDPLHGATLFAGGSMLAAAGIVCASIA